MQDSNEGMIANGAPRKLTKEDIPEIGQMTMWQAANGIKELFQLFATYEQTTEGDTPIYFAKIDLTEFCDELPETVFQKEFSNGSNGIPEEKLGFFNDHAVSSMVEEMQDDYPRIFIAIVAALMAKGAGLPAPKVTFPEAVSSQG